MPDAPRNFVLEETNYLQLKAMEPNVAVLPWGATESHGHHLPHGTDCIEAVAVSEAAIARANQQGARCVLLPCVPFGNDNMQLSQIATITMRSTTQHAVLHDVAESLVRQGIDRLVVMNFHGGNDFRSSIRDIMLDLPIFMVQVNAYQVAPRMAELLTVKGGDHAEEFETSLMLHLRPELVVMAQAGDGATTPFKLKSLGSTPGVWAPRDWEALTKTTGAGDPRAANAEKGKRILEMLVDAIVPVLTELSAAKNGDFPYVVRKRP